ncbi:MAG: tripartite tricarboxylate transporter substrate binding protein [Bradyrhizobiaceae bacterium]|nr:tripartite tricarboxylate transporter substrate binding protein [Bradyrhizobiaceae bacterium]
MRPLSRRTVLGSIAGGLPGLLASSPARAWPTRPVRIVVPFPPGGGADLLSRMLAPHLQKALGQPFFIENRAGAAGRIGTGIVAKSDPDGHTLLVTTESSIVIAPHTGVDMAYNPLVDLDPVSLLTRNTVLLVVHPSLPARDLEEFMALARAKPGEMSYGSSGVGGPNHLAGELFKSMTGLNIVHIPFSGTGAALQGVIANQVGAMWGFMAGLIPHVRAGTLRAIASGGRERAAALPDVPTFAEAGLPGYEAVSWIGMFVPHGTNGAVVDGLAGAVKNAMQEQDVSDALARDGSEAAITGPSGFRRIIASDDAKYAKLAHLFR